MSANPFFAKVIPGFGDNLKIDNAATSVNTDDDNNLPIGLQVIGNVLREDQLFQVAYAYEQSTDWHQRLPEVN